MAAVVVVMAMCRCRRCDHEWWPRGATVMAGGRPAKCPKCQSFNWESDLPVRLETGKEMNHERMAG